MSVKKALAILRASIRPTTDAIYTLRLAKKIKEARIELEAVEKAQSKLGLEDGKPTGSSLTHTLGLRKWQMSNTHWKIWAKDALELIGRLKEQSLPVMLDTCAEQSKPVEQPNSGPDNLPDIDSFNEGTGKPELGEFTKENRDFINDANRDFQANRIEGNCVQDYVRALRELGKACYRLDRQAEQLKDWQSTTCEGHDPLKEDTLPRACPYCAVGHLAEQLTHYKKLTSEALGGAISDFDLLLASERAARSDICKLKQQLTAQAEALQKQVSKEDAEFLRGVSSEIIDLKVQLVAKDKAHREEIFHLNDRCVEMCRAKAKEIERLKGGE